MSIHAYIYSPRGTRQLFPRLAPKYTFAPSIRSGPYVPPKPPSPLKAAPKEKKAHPSVEELREAAAALRREAKTLDKEKPKPSMRIQLGLVILERIASDPANGVAKVVKAWDSKGKGEIAKGEFRLHLRTLLEHATSADADAIFASVDEDGGGCKRYLHLSPRAPLERYSFFLAACLPHPAFGSRAPTALDLAEIRGALTTLASEARAWRDTPELTSVKIAALRQRAAEIEEAAEATVQADEREAELRAKVEALASRADVRLGQLLQKRKIKPGAVVTQWSHSRGKHQGELSKAEFREACLSLGLDQADAEDIDKVFDDFDEVPPPPEPEPARCSPHARATATAVRTPLPTVDRPPMFPVSLPEHLLTARGALLDPLCTPRMGAATWTRTRRRR
jgi:hypothetical protein